MKQQLLCKAWLAVAALALAGCAASSVDGAGPGWTAQALLGSHWVDADPPKGPLRVSLDIGADASISGSAACNRYMGRVDISGSTVRLTRIASTNMWCVPEAVMDSETRFKQALDQTRSARHESGLLLLLDDSGRVLWRFRPRP
jgi:heat shock protein HslJ